MIWLARRIWRDFQNWDRPTQIAFSLALILGIFGIIFTALAPQEQRFGLAIGVGALLLVAEIAVLWGGRGAVTPYSAAQHKYLAGDLDGARDILERARESGHADMRALTLLGATYRQFGALDQSAAVLYEALDKVPEHHYPLYNLGRTLLAMGRYIDAVALIEQAIVAGAPQTASFDLGEGLILAGQPENALPHLVADHFQEAHRTAMVGWWRWQLGVDKNPPEAGVLRDGLPYWKAAAQRFEATPYGTAIEANIEAIQRYLRSLEDV